MIIPIDKFFAEMELSDEDKKRREKLAHDLYLVFWTLFSEIEAEKLLHGIENIDVEYYKDMLFRQYSRNVETFVVMVAALLGDRKLPKQLRADIRIRTSDIVDTTLKFKDEFYTSDDRATMLGCNEANFIGNDTNYRIAEYQGYRHKQWLTMKDEKVRITHAMIDGQTIGIDDYFHVGAAEMLYPMDMSRNAYEHPEETVSCRCSVAYLR